MQVNQHGSLDNNDPYAHISSFLEIRETFKQNGVFEDAIRLRLFPIYLRDKANGWLNSQPTSPISTC